MFRNLTHQTKALLLVVLLFMLWWVTPIATKRLTYVTFYEFQAPAWSAISYLRDLRDYWTLYSRPKDELVEVGINLARLNAAYVNQSQQIDSLKRQIEGLEYFYSLTPLDTYDYVVARVVQRNTSAWWQRMIIRKGANHGIKEGMIVIHRGGVVGRINEVNAYTSTVQLITSPDFRTVVHFEGDDRPFEFRGNINQPFRPPSGQILSAPADISVQPDNPRRIVTFGLEGNFPDGIPLGIVYNMDISQDGLFQTGNVSLDSDLAQLREVAVLVPASPQQNP